MAGPNPETDLRVLRNLIDEALMTVTAPEFPNGRGARAGEILASALALADDILAAPPGSSAATMGKLGGLRPLSVGHSISVKLQRRERQDLAVDLRSNRIRAIRLRSTPLHPGHIPTASFDIDPTPRNWARLISWH